MQCSQRQTKRNPGKDTEYQMQDVMILLLPWKQPRKIGYLNCLHCARRNNTSSDDPSKQPHTSTVVLPPDCEARIRYYRSLQKSVLVFLNQNLRFILIWRVRNHPEQRVHRTCQCSLRSACITPFNILINDLDIQLVLGE